MFFFDFCGRKKSVCTQLESTMLKSGQCVCSSEINHEFDIKEGCFKLICITFQFYVFKFTSI